MNEVYLAYQWGDFDIPVVLGVGTDREAAVKIIKNTATKSWQRKIEERKPDYFWVVSTMDHMEEYKYWIEKVKTNKPL